MILISQVGHVDLQETIQNLSDLPDELLLEIASHFEAPDPLELAEDLSNAINNLPTPYSFERRGALTALSETCRRLRQLFRPLLWERIEVCSGMRVGQLLRKLEDSPMRAKKKDFSKELLRQLRVATTMDPTLAQYVRIVNVQITDASLPSVFLELGHSFSRFPNLHTVRIVQHINLIKPGATISTSNQKAVRRGFRKTITYPQIRSAILSAIAYPLVEVCPNLLNFKAATGFNFQCLLKSLTKAPHLRAFSAGHHLGVEKAKILAEAMPLLEEITIFFLDACSAEGQRHFEETLRSFKNLRTLILQTAPAILSGSSIKQFLLCIPQTDFKALKQIKVQTMYCRGPTEEIINLPVTDSVMGPF